MKPPLAMIHSPNFWKAGSVENSRAMDILLVSLANWASSSDMRWTGGFVCV